MYNRGMEAGDRRPAAGTHRAVTCTAAVGGRAQRAAHTNKQKTPQPGYQPSRRGGGWKNTVELRGTRRQRARRGGWSGEGVGRRTASSGRGPGGGSGSPRGDKAHNSRHRRDVELGGQPPPSCCHAEWRSCARPHAGRWWQLSAGESPVTAPEGGARLGAKARS